MSNHSSATPHTIKSTKNRKLNASATKRTETRVTNSTRTKTLNRNGTRGARQKAGTGGRNRKTTISNTLRRRAQAVINDKSIDAQSRAIIRYGLETNDPWLAELVRRADAGETIIYTVNSLKHPHRARM